MKLSSKIAFIIGSLIIQHYRTPFIMSFSFLPPVLFNKTPLTSFLLFSFIDYKGVSESKGYKKRYESYRNLLLHIHLHQITDLRLRPCRSAGGERLNNN